jgi:hypothetical protein
MSRNYGGRPRKEGQRYPCGQLRHVRDLGSDGIQLRRKLHGVQPGEPDHSHDAIGRAFHAGLLGDPSEGMARMLVARRARALYRPELGSPRSSLASLGLPRVGPLVSNDDRNDHRERAFKALMVKVREIGRDHVAAFTDLALIDYPDRGPAWLDRLIANSRSGAPARAEDQRSLKAARLCLDALLRDHAAPNS